MTDEKLSALCNLQAKRTDEVGRGLLNSHTYGDYPFKQVVNKVT